jgi:myo-inositol-1(or 4)-monophosphatase
MGNEETGQAEIAERAATAGADRALAMFQGELAVETKSNAADLVTEADREAQRAVFETIRERYPDDPIVGEEEDALKEVPATGPAWIVDPIDGTANYVRGNPIWGTSVAAVVDREAVAGTTVLPALGDTYVADDATARLNGEPISVSARTDPAAAQVATTLWWGFMDGDTHIETLGEIGRTFGDIRRFGSAQATLAMVASGTVDAAASPITPNPWDSVVGVQLIRNAGGVVTDVYGDRWEVGAEGLVASNGHLHDALLDLMG